MLGGFDSSDVSALPGNAIPGLLIYNMSDNTWLNESARAYSTYGTALNGDMHFLSSYGLGGILVIMGGEFADIGPWIEKGNNQIPFSNISIYDTEQKTWHWQTATGLNGPSDIPKPATMFCSVTASDPNSVTVEIFMYGGHDDPFVEYPDGDPPDSTQKAAQASFNAVYVLSLPGFIWMKVNGTTAPSRTGHSCNAIGGHMISIGGLDPTTGWGNGGPNPWQYADPWKQSIGIFDMTNLNWIPSYDPDAPPYKVPQALKTWYAQSSSNSSIHWTDSTTQALFFPSKSANNNGTSPASSSPTSSASPASSSLHAGAIAGIVIGCLAFAALVVAVTWYCLRRRRGHRRHPNGPLEIVTNGELTDKALLGNGGKSLNELHGCQTPVEMDPTQSRRELDALMPHEKDAGGVRESPVELPNEVASR